MLLTIVLTLRVKTNNMADTVTIVPQAAVTLSGGIDPTVLVEGPMGLMGDLCEIDAIIVRNG